MIESVEQLLNALSDDDWPVTTVPEALEKIEYYKECAEYCKTYK